MSNAPGPSFDPGPQLNGQQADPAAEAQLLARQRARARHVVYERLAFVSAAVWALGTLFLFITIVPFVARPQAYIAIAITVPIIPAALPWLFYGRISDVLARRWAARTADLHRGEG